MSAPISFAKPPDETKDRGVGKSSDIDNGTSAKNGVLIACIGLFLVSVLLEILAFTYATRAHGSGWSRTLALALLLHMIASILGAVSAVLAAPATSRRPYLRPMALSTLLNFSAPLLGLLLVGAARIGFAYSVRNASVPILQVREPDYSVQRNIAQQRRKVSARINVLDTRLAASDRLNAQLALQDAPGKISADVLRTLLTDPIEDIRLLAYGLLDGKEKKVSQRILAEQDQLKIATDEQELYAGNRRLAELNWELIYQRMVQGDMRRFSAEQALRYARAGLTIKPDDGGLWFLCARVNLAIVKPDEAAADLEQAKQLGVPAIQLLPYYAEMAFEKRDFAQVRTFLHQLPEKPSSQSLGAVYEFWT